MRIKEPLHPVEAITMLLLLRHSVGVKKTKLLEEVESIFNFKPRDFCGHVNSMIRRGFVEEVWKNDGGRLLRATEAGKKWFCTPYIAGYVVSAIERQLIKASPGAAYTGENMSESQKSSNFSEGKYVEDMRMRTENPLEYWSRILERRKRQVAWIERQIEAIKNAKK